MPTETDLPLHMPDGELIGRMPVGADESEFDFLAPRWVDVTPEQLAAQPDLFAGTGVEPSRASLFAANGDKPAPFAAESPAAAEFPILSAAARKFASDDAAPRVVRVDTDATHGEFVCEAAVRELSRRVDELRAAVDEHLQAHAEEEHPGFHKSAKRLRRWEDILGAVETIKKLGSAPTADAAAQHLPQVPVNVPPFAEGKVKCWRDGDAIVCSMRFQAADGTARVATMAAKPQASASEVMGWLSKSGANPIHVLGAVPAIAEVQSARKLVRDVAGAALAAQRRLDVLGQSYDKGGEALILSPSEDEDADPALAAVMYVEQRARAGDVRAAREVAKLEAASATPAGRVTVAPLHAEARARLDAAQERRRRQSAPSRMEKYSQMALCLG